MADVDFKAEAERIIQHLYYDEYAGSSSDELARELRRVCAAKVRDVCQEREFSGNIPPSVSREFGRGHNSAATACYDALMRRAREIEEGS